MTEITSYAWRDDDGALHVSIHAMLRAMQMADTPANRERVEKSVIDVMRSDYPGILVVQEDEQLH